MSSLLLCTGCRWLVLILSKPVQNLENPRCPYQQDSKYCLSSFHQYAAVSQDESTGAEDTLFMVEAIGQWVLEWMSFAVISWTFFSCLRAKGWCGTGTGFLNFPDFYVMVQLSPLQHSWEKGNWKIVVLGFYSFTFFNVFVSVHSPVWNAFCLKYIS